MSDVLVVYRQDSLDVASQTATLTLDRTRREVISEGAQGPAGPSAFVSADPNNRTVTGTDGGFFTPDIVADPLAYYILAKA
jgi:hypothetical protein